MGILTDTNVVLDELVLVNVNPRRPASEVLIEPFKVVEDPKNRSMRPSKKPLLVVEALPLDPVVRDAALKIDSKAPGKFTAVVIGVLEEVELVTETLLVLVIKTDVEEVEVMD